MRDPVGETVQIAEPAIAARPPTAQPLDLFAIDLFFIALDDATGRIRVHPEVAGAALGAALLAELITGECIEVESGHVATTAAADMGRTMPADALGHTVLETIRGQSQPLTAVQWIRFLALSAEKDVADRLCRANRITTGRKWSGFSGKVTCYRAVDKNKAAWPRARLSDHWSVGRDISGFDIVLTELCHHAGLLRSILAPALSYDPGLYHRVVQASNERLAMCLATGDPVRDTTVTESMKELLDALDHIVTASTGTLA